MLAHIELVFVDTPTRSWRTLIGCSTGSIACRWSELACFIKIDGSHDRILLYSLEPRFTFSEFIIIEHRLSFGHCCRYHSFISVVILGSTISSRLLGLLGKENSLFNIINCFKVEAKCLFSVYKSFVMIMFAQSFHRQRSLVSWSISFNERSRSLLLEL